MKIGKQLFLEAFLLLHTSASDRQICTIVSCCTVWLRITFSPPEADRTENTREMTDESDRCYAMLFLKVEPDTEFCHSRLLCVNWCFFLLLLLLFLSQGCNKTMKEKWNSITLCCIWQYSKNYRYHIIYQWYLLLMFFIHYYLSSQLHRCDAHTLCLNKVNVNADGKKSKS